MRKPVVVFDLDGTLVDSAAAIRDVASQVMSELGLAPLDLAETRSYIGDGLVVFLRRVLAARGEAADGDLAPLVARFEEFHRNAPASANPPYPGAETMLRHLVTTGHRLALCTNKQRAPTEYILEAFGWDDLFQAVVAGGVGGDLKPHPRPLLEAIARAGGGPAIYVGDSEVDAACATAAGVPFVLYTEGYHKSPIADIAHVAAFEDFADLAGILEGVGSGE